MTFSNLIFCQKKSFEGYYKDYDGNEIKGSFPGYKQWSKSPKTVSFKSVNGNKITLTTQNCRSFYINNLDIYIAYKGRRIKNSIDVTQVDSYDSTTRYENINSFLRVIYKSENLSLFLFKDASRTNIFCQQGNGEIIELENKYYITQTNNTKNIIGIKNYQKQLAALLPSNITENQKNKLSALDYSEKAIVDLINQVYNNSIITKIKNEPSKFFIGTGFSFNRFNYKSNLNGDENQMIDYKSTGKPLFIAGFNFYLNRNFNKLFISPRIKVFSQKSFGETDIILSPTSSYTLKSTYKTNPIIFTGINLGYSFIKKETIDCYISGGPGFLFLLNNKETREEIIPAQPNRSGVISDSRFIFALNAEAGVTVNKKITFWTSYHPSIALITYSYGAARLSAFQVGANWIVPLKK